MSKQVVYKKGISLILSYVLLISMGLAMAGSVYLWLKYYATPDEGESCPDEVSLSIMSVNYTKDSSGRADSLRIVVQNRGNFKIVGFLIRANSQPGSDSASRRLYLNENSFLPGGEEVIDLDVEDLKEFTRVCFITVQPYRLSKDGDILPCDIYSSRKIDC